MKLRSLLGLVVWAAAAPASAVFNFGSISSGPPCGAAGTSPSPGATMQVQGNGGCAGQITFSNGQFWTGVIPGGGVTISGTGSGVFDAGFFPIGFAATALTGPGSAVFQINGQTLRSGSGGQGLWNVATDLLGQTLGTWQVTLSFPSQPISGPGFPPPPPGNQFSFCIFLGTNSLCNTQSNNAQTNPIFPSSGGGGSSWVFSNVPSGLWFDPPFVDAFEYTGTSGTTFSSITLPSGYTALDVWVGGSSIGTFNGGQSVNLGDASSFQIRGINPQADSALADAFPLQIFFTGGGTGSFTQAGFTAAPEPSTWLLMAGAGYWLIRRPR